MMEKLLLIWTQPQSRKKYVVGSLIKYENKFVFEYVNPELKDAKSDGFDYFQGFEDITKKYESEILFTNIIARLPNTLRPDYLKICNEYDLLPCDSDWERLKKTKGRMLTDGYEFVSAFQSKRIEFDIAGVQYYKDIEKCKNLLGVNVDLKLKHEPDNPKDSNAIQICFYDSKNKKDYMLGYVPRYYSKHIVELLKEKINYSAKIKTLINPSLYKKDKFVDIVVKLMFEEK